MTNIMKTESGEENLKFTDEQFQTIMEAIAGWGRKIDEMFESQKKFIEGLAKGTEERTQIEIKSEEINFEMKNENKSAEKNKEQSGKIVEETEDSKKEDVCEITVKEEENSKYTEEDGKFEIFGEKNIRENISGKVEEASAVSDKYLAKTSEIGIATTITGPLQNHSDCSRAFSRCTIRSSDNLPCNQLSDLFLSPGVSSKAQKFWNKTVCELDNSHFKLPVLSCRKICRDGELRGVFDGGKTFMNFVQGIIYEAAAIITLSKNLKLIYFIISGHVT